MQNQSTTVPNVANSQQLIDALFQRAKSTDEFEYICSMLRIRGMEDIGWDPLEESHAAILDYIALIDAPLQDITKVRLALLTYCHITEIDAVYDMLANMLRTINGQRCSMTPFYSEDTKKLAQSPKQKILAIQAMEQKLGLDSIGKIIESFFEDEIRNSFYHSDYTLFSNEFRYHKRVGTWRTGSAMPVGELMRKIQDCINFYLMFMNLYDTHRRRYKKSKVIRGRLAANGGWLDVELLVRPGAGVVGFKNPPKTRV